jgi:hypothetical protein
MLVATQVASAARARGVDVTKDHTNVTITSAPRARGDDL